MLGMSAPIYTNITFPFTMVPALMAPYVSHDNPTGWAAHARRECTGFHVPTPHAISVG